MKVNSSQLSWLTLDAFLDGKVMSFNLLLASCLRTFSIIIFSKHGPHKILWSQWQSVDHSCKWSEGSASYISAQPHPHTVAATLLSVMLFFFFGESPESRNVLYRLRWGEDCPARQPLLLRLRLSALNSWSSANGPHTHSSPCLDPACKETERSSGWSSHRLQSEIPVSFLIQIISAQDHMEQLAEKYLHWNRAVLTIYYVPDVCSKRSQFAEAVPDLEGSVSPEQIVLCGAGMDFIHQYVGHPLCVLLQLLQDFADLWSIDVVTCENNNKTITSHEAEAEYQQCETLCL